MADGIFTKAFVPKENDRGCLTVRERGDYLVEIIGMIYNYRLVITPKSNLDIYEAGWCYFGTDPVTFARVLAAAQRFDPMTQTDPEGYDKALQERTLDG